MMYSESEHTKHEDLVSIIMPSYNTARYISESIKSVLAQTYQNWELLIVDDCSTDNTDKVVEPYLADSRIRFFRNEQNSGAAVSRNRALREAKGRWIAFLDSDDLWKPEKLEKQISFMKENDYHFSYTNYSEIDENGNHTGIIVTGPRKITRTGFYNYCWPGCLTVMYDKDAVGLVQIADIRKNNDYAMWLKISQKVDYCHLLNDDLAFYRRGRTGSITNHSIKTMISWHYKMYKEAEGQNVLMATVNTMRNMIFGFYKKKRYVSKLHEKRRYKNFERTERIGNINSSSVHRLSVHQLHSSNIGYSAKSPSINGWKYYNHAAIPTCAPHEIPDLKPIQDGSIWKLGGRGYATILARWTTDWDCGYETNWWYVIKDTPFDINALKAKRRYEITKGNKNFDIKVINPTDYSEDIYNVTVLAYKAWPAKYRPKINKAVLLGAITKWNTVFAAFDKNTKCLYGYALVEDFGQYADFSILRTDPNMEKFAINAAIVDGILNYYRDRLKEDSFYICDGSRAIRHETFFQDYLEKYFGFRKAYCNLNLKYKRYVGLIIDLLYPFRKLITGKTYITSQLKAILELEKIRRDQKLIHTS